MGFPIFDLWEWFHTTCWHLNFWALRGTQRTPFMLGKKWWISITIWQPQRKNVTLTHFHFFSNCWYSNWNHCKLKARRKMKLKISHQGMISVWSLEFKITQCRARQVVCRTRTTVMLHIPTQRGGMRRNKPKLHIA